MVKMILSSFAKQEQEIGQQAELYWVKQLVYETEKP